MPANVTIDTSEQGTEAWLRARCGRFTASRASDLMMRQKNGKPYASRKDYITQIALERVTGELPEQIMSQAMLEGRERERTAALAYSFKTGNTTAQTGFWHTKTYGASPDDLIEGQNGGVEYKNPKSSTHYTTLKAGTIPEHYYWQILQNLLVTGKDFWDYVSFHPSFPENSQLFIKRIERTAVASDLARLEEELESAEQEVQTEIKFITEYNG